MKTITNCILLSRLLKPASLLTILLISVMTPQSVWACMPHSPSDVFIGRVQALSSVQDDNDALSFDIQFNRHRFVFRSFLSWFKYSQPEQWRSNFELKNIEKNELVIGLAYDPDGSKPADYTISSLASLRCKNDTLVIGKPLVSFVAWNRESESCRHDSSTPIDILDGFFTKNQAYYLQKLQAKYPTCSQLELAFPMTANDVNTINKVSNVAEKPQPSEINLSLWRYIKQWLQQLS